VAAMTLISRILGFSRDVVIANYFGAGPGTDAFFVAFRIPNLFRRLFAEGALSQAFIPVLAGYKENHNKSEIVSFIAAVSGNLSLILILLTVWAWLFTPSFLIIFAPGFEIDSQQFSMASDMLRLTFPYLPLISLTALSAGILNTWDRFAIPAITPAILNITILTTIFLLAPRLDSPIMALAWGVLFAGLLQLGFQLPQLFKLDLLVAPRINFEDKGVRRVMKRMAPAIFSASVSQLNLVINTVLASFLMTGSISWLYYSDRLVEFPLGLLGAGIGSVILPHLSKSHAKKNSDEFSQSLEWASRWTKLIGLPASAALIALSQPLMLTLFQHDQFSVLDAEMASRSLMAYAIGLMGFISTKILVPGFSARGDLRSPARFALYSVMTNTILAIALGLYILPNGWQHAGLALATSAASLLNALLLLTKLKTLGFYPKTSGRTAFNIRISVALLIMTLILMFSANHYPWQEWTRIERFLNLSIWIIVGLGSYILTLLVTGFRMKDLLLSSSIRS
jgi:putative peptidoglycan lipid II flippase